MDIRSTLSSKQKELGVIVEQIKDLEKDKDILKQQALILMGAIDILNTQVSLEELENTYKPLTNDERNANPDHA
jgi:hypothetical protein